MMFGVCVRYRAFIFCVCVCVNAYVYTHTHICARMHTYKCRCPRTHTHTHVARFLHVTHDVSSRPPRTCAVSSRPASPVLATAPAGPGRLPGLLDGFRAATQLGLLGGGGRDGAAGHRVTRVSCSRGSRSKERGPGLVWISGLVFC